MKHFAAQPGIAPHTGQPQGADRQPTPADDRLRFQAQLLEAVEQAVMATDLDGVVTYWNRYAERLYGWTAEEAVGQNVIDLIVTSQAPRQDILEHLRTGESWSAEIVVRRKNGTTLPVQVTRSAVRDEAGRLVGIVGVSTDISRRKDTEAALASSEERLRVAQQAGGVGTFEWDLRTGEVKVSDEFCLLWGMRPHGSLRVGVFSELVHPEDQGLLASEQDRPLEETVGYTEYRIRRHDTGEERWLARRGEIVRDEDGQPVRVVGAVYDITERKGAEQQQRLLMAELAHRVKNTFAMVQAVATQTMRNATSLDEARDTFTARLANLAHAHDALMQESWASAGIQSVVSGAIRPHDPQGRVVWDGPDLSLGPKAALGLSLALHELGTNATKYGALSVPEGHVEIAWSVADAAEQPGFHFRWQEHGGPQVTPPTRKGFGSRLIERGLSGSLGGNVRIAYEPAGVVLTIDAPLAALQDASQS